MNILEMISKRQKEMDKKYSILFGLKLNHCGQTWVLVATNDLGVPYFCKLKGKKPQKTQYVLSGIRQNWLNNELRRINNDDN